MCEPLNVEVCYAFQEMDALRDHVPDDSAVQDEVEAVNGAFRVVKLDGESCALFDFQLCTGVCDLLAVEFASAPFGVPVQQPVPNGEGDDCDEQYADDDGKPRDCPPWRLGENADVGRRVSG